MISHSPCPSISSVCAATTSRLSSRTSTSPSPCVTSGQASQQVRCATDYSKAGYPLNRENGQKHSLSGKTQGIRKFCQNTGNLVCSSCKFPDSKGKQYFDICRENCQIVFEAGYVYQGSLVYVIVTNHVNWHRENLQSDSERKKRGKTQGI